MHLNALAFLPSTFGFNPDRKRTLKSFYHDQASHVNGLPATSSLLLARSSHLSPVSNMLSRKHPRTCVPWSCPFSCSCRHCPLPSARPSFVCNFLLRPLNISPRTLSLPALSTDPLLVWNYGVMAALALMTGVVFWWSVSDLDAKEDELNNLAAGHVGVYDEKC